MNLSSKGSDLNIFGSTASQPIPALALIEISPVIFFTADEYEKHGKFTALDSYTFKWRDGRMALALGVGTVSES